MLTRRHHVGCSAERRPRLSVTFGVIGMTMDVKGVIADQMGMFTPYDIVGALIGLVLAALLGFVLGRVVKGRAGDEANELMVMALLSALAVELVKTSVPLAITMVAIMLFIKEVPGALDRDSRLLRIAAVLLGFGCGSGAGIITLVCAVPLMLVMRWSLANSRA